MKSNHIEQNFQLPSNLEFRKTLLDKFKSFVLKRLDEAMKVSNGATSGILQRYLAVHRKSLSFHLGASIAGRMGMSSNAAVDLIGLAVNDDSLDPLFNKIDSKPDYAADNAYRFWDLFNLQCYHRGGIETLKHHLETNLPGPVQSQWDNIIDECKKDLKSFVTLSSGPKKFFPDETKLRDVFFRAASLLIYLEKVKTK